MPMLCYFSRYNRQSHKYQFSDVVLEAYDQFKSYASNSRFGQTMGEISKPLLPDITVKKGLGAEPPYMYCHQGKETLMRIPDSGKGFENRCNSAATLHSMVGSAQTLGVVKAGLCE